MKSELYLSHRNAELFRQVNKGNEIMLTKIEYVCVTAVVGVVFLGFIGIIAWVNTIANVVVG